MKNMKNIFVDHTISRRTADYNDYIHISTKIGP